MINLLLKQSRFLLIYQFLTSLAKMPFFYSQFWKFKISAKDSEFSTDFSDIYPCLDEAGATHSFDGHYVYHPAWAARIIRKTQPKIHTDIASTLHFSTILSAFVPTHYYDLRKLNLELSNIDTKVADLTKLPFRNNSISSLSCMHVIEHIGLGRYGDCLDIDGDRKAINELIRVVKPGGNLLIVVPIGEKPKIMFNAHRIYTYDLILSYFSDFFLKNFSLVTDDPNVKFYSPAKKSQANKQKYGCGCFWFTKRK